MRHGDAFAGIGGFGLAAERVGWTTVWAAENDKSARAIYESRLGHPGLRFDSDIRDSRAIPAIDILTGGFPCQDLSIAGKRAGLAGERSGLFFELVRLLQESKPEWFVFENVPGLLSSNKGRDMALILDSLVECGYGVAYRVLNAQFFGVAQRRRRVFLVGHSCGEWKRAASILFEPESGGRDLTKGDEARAEVAATLGSNAKGGQRTTDLNVPLTIAFTVSPHDAHIGNGWNTNHIVQQAISSKWAKGSSGPAGDEHHNLVTSFAQNQQGELRTSDVIPALGGTGGKPGQGYPAVLSSPPNTDGVRTPSGLSRSLDVCEVCEEGPDSPRYKCIGNAVAVPVVEWIFRRIKEVS